MTSYRDTHPWLTFELDLRSAMPRLWLLLGEARSKIEHLAGVPLRPSTAQEMSKISLVRGALATTAIEGNTLSEEEARRFLEDSSSLSRSRRYLGEEVLSVVEACNQIWDRFASSNEEEITLERILAYNAQVLKGSHYSEDVVPGALRSHVVGVARYRAPPPEELPELMNRFVAWFTSASFREKVPSLDDTEGPPAMAIVGAILAHLYFAWIHPFGDGNGRTARLIEFAMLLRADVPTVAAHLLSNHYNETRSEYYQQLQRASATRDPLPFIVYALQGFVDGLRGQIAKVRDEQLDVVWRNYVHERFRSESGPVARRRRELVLQLSRVQTPVQRAAVNILSPALAEAYRSLTPKAISRDLKLLEEMKLLEEVDGGWRARKRDIEAFIPPRRTRVRTGR